MPDSGDTRCNHTRKQRDLDKEVFYHVVRLLECEYISMATCRTFCRYSQVVIFSNSSSVREEERVHCACRCRVSKPPTVVTGDNKFGVEILG